MGSKCFVRSGSEPGGWPSDWIFSQFGKVNIRMEKVPKETSFGLEDFRVIKASNKNNGRLHCLSLSGCGTMSVT